MTGVIHRWPLATLAVLVILPAVARAQGGVAASPTLRLGDVYTAIGENNPRAAAARSLADAARARIPGAGLPSDPQLQLAFMNYGLADLRPMDALGMVQLQVMQMIPTAGKPGLSRRVATARAAAEGERAADVAWELRSRAAMAWYELYEANASIAIAAGTRRLLEDIARAAAAMYEVGEGRQADVLRARVEIARMNEQITRMEAMRSAAIARLGALLDRAMGDSTRAAALPRFPDAVPSVDSLVRVALRQRPMIRAGGEDLRAADAMVTLAQRELVPDLVVGVQYGQRTATMGTERMGSLMIGASVPVFANRRQAGLRDEAGAMRAMAQADLRYLQADTRGRITEAHAALTSARNLARLYTTTVLPQAEATVASAMAAYRVGEVDFMTLLDSRMTVNAYRQELVALRVSEGRAWADLEMLIGHELFDPDSTTLATASGGRP
ncbi:MAG TPA: TolC family protein [Gemmatimonadaceae bacterium]|nr:TolC family protein [Gemmatimonadaceae bacterium]